MANLITCLLALLFSFSSPAMVVNADFWHPSLAAEAARATCSVAFERRPASGLEPCRTAVANPANALPRPTTPQGDGRLATLNGQTVANDPDGNLTTGPLTNN